MRDFTLEMFKRLCMAFKRNGYGFITFSDHCIQERPRRFVILRHDVDRSPGRALTMARCENAMKIRASYYFRIVNQSYDAGIITRIAELDHEIGYHYEDLSLARGDHEKAIGSFEENIAKLRRSSTVRTICMHGSPLSKWDNRLLWQRYSYRDHGVVGEPYFDIDFHKVLYLTDTGRRWNGMDTNVRDTVDSGYRHDMRTTAEVIASLDAGGLPAQIMMNVHPQRWSDDVFPWVIELLWQGAKNAGKRSLSNRYRAHV